MSLLPIENVVLQETWRKRYAFMFLGSGCFEMILALLIEVVAIYMRVTIVQFGIPRFERPIKIVSSLSWGRGSYWGLGPFDKSSHKLLKEVIVWRGHRSRSKSGCRCGCRYRTWSGTGAPNGRSSTSKRRHNGTKSRDKVERSSLPSKRAG